jgi:hypothetical protein
MIVRVSPLLLLFLTACVSNTNPKKASFTSTDSLQILAMVHQRERAMVSRDIDLVSQQFDSNANFINGGGFLYQGITEIRNFHNSMFTNDSLMYTYKIGKVFISPIQEDVAMVYYPWQQQWTLKKVTSDTLNEVGLMTIIATKKEGEWKWNAITNQRTKTYFEDLSKHKASGIQ